MFKKNEGHNTHFTLNCQQVNNLSVPLQYTIGYAYIFRWQSEQKIKSQQEDSMACRERCYYQDYVQLERY